MSTVTCLTVQIIQHVKCHIAHSPHNTTIQQSNITQSRLYKKSTVTHHTVQIIQHVNSYKSQNRLKEHVNSHIALSSDYTACQQSNITQYKLYNQSTVTLHTVWILQQINSQYQTAYIIQHFNSHMAHSPQNTRWKSYSTQSTYNKLSYSKQPGLYN